MNEKRITRARRLVSHSDFYSSKTTESFSPQPAPKYRVGVGTFARASLPSAMDRCCSFERWYVDGGCRGSLVDDFPFHLDADGRTSRNCWKCAHCIAGGSVRRLRRPH